MSIAPIITFKAGICDVDQSTPQPYKVKPRPAPGYVYLYLEDELVHFCWRERNVPLDDPELDLVMVPTDGHFVPYTHDDTSAKTNGRVFVLKFSSSSQRHLFWLQSKPQARNGDPSWLSPRDRKIGEIVDALLQGEDVNVSQELASAGSSDDRDDDNDETMEDIEGTGDPHAHRRGGGGGAGPDATGGDVREEGQGSREGGADGARAAASYSAEDAASAAVRNLLSSLTGGARSGQQEEKDAYPYLTHLLPKEVTLPVIESATEEYLDSLLSFLPPSVIMLAAGAGTNASVADPSPDDLTAARASLSIGDKKVLLNKVLRSPQFHQSLASLSLALKDGGLPGIADALDINVANGGYIRGGGMPLGGDEAIKAFVEGVKKTVEE